MSHAGLQIDFGTYDLSQAKNGQYYTPYTTQYITDGLLRKMII